MAPDLRPSRPSDRGGLCVAEPDGWIRGVEWGGANMKTMTTAHWTTYRTTGYTHDVAQYQASAGGVHHHQVRRARNGWQYRIVQANGRHTSYGAVASLSAVDDAARWATAMQS